MNRTRRITAALAAMACVAACTTGEPSPEGDDSLRSLAEGYVLTTLPSGDSAMVRLSILDVDRVPEGTDLERPLDDRRFLLFMPTVRAFDPGFEFGEASGIVSDGGPMFFDGGNLLLRGDLAADDLAPPAEQLSDGIWTYGQGDDREVMAGANDLDSLGRPVRVGKTDSELFYSLSTGAVEQWLEGAGTVGENDQVMAVIDELDERDAFAAFVATALDPRAPIRQSNQADREAALERLEEILLIRDACHYLGVGYAEADGGVTSHVVYHFGTSETAEGALESVEAAWRDGLGSNLRPVTDMVDEVISVEQSDELVVVTLDAGENGMWLVSGLNQAPLACGGTSG